jgi:hypothetical protein
VVKMAKPRFVRRGLGVALLLAFLVYPAWLLADGGVIRLRQASGPFIVTVFTTATTLRAGPADVSVMVQDRKSQAVILDATVVLAIEPQTGTAGASEVLATSRQATNKLLKAAVLNFPSAGTWLLTVTVRRGPQKVVVSTYLHVAPPLPRVAAIWPYLALPPFAILLFAANQALRRRTLSRSGIPLTEAHANPIK